MLGNLDALTRSIKTPAVESAAYPVHLAADDPKRQIVGSLDGPAELVRAQLIGPAPQPRFPEILRDRKIDGDVVVRFTVDAQGRPVTSSIVVLRTPHELLSDVVRRAIATMRFEPAHRATIGAPAQPDEIQMSFQFSSGVKLVPPSPGVRRRVSRQGARLRITGEHEHATAARVAIR